MQQRQHSLGRKEPAIYTYEPKFNISDVADLLGIQKLSDGNSFGVVCPFCGDTQGKMNFRIMKDNEYLPRILLRTAGKYADTVR